MSSSANTPGEAEFDFYDSSPVEQDQLYQGEVLTNVPILTMPKPSRWLLLRTKSGRRVDNALEQGNLGGLVRVLDSNQSNQEWQEDGRGDFAMAVLDKRPVLVLSQTCDVQTKAFIQIAPIYPADSDLESLERLKAGRIYSAFWLKQRVPEIPQESYADLELTQAIHKSYLNRISLGQHFRLSPERIRLLQKAITRYFGRPNSFDAHSDTAPAAGTFLCVQCFYRGALVTQIELAQGTAFPICTNCHGTQWVVKGR